MLREIVLDTETTGLDPALGHRIIEIGALELINHIPSGRIFHKYINPERDIPLEAFAVHGLSIEFLSQHPVFSAVVDELDAFLADARLIMHNAAFDLGFLERELRTLGRLPISRARIIDTLALARQRHPTAGNSLDALCRRYNIDHARRAKHGALLDAELLAEVYLELIGGRQASLILSTAVVARPSAGRTGMAIRAARAMPLRPRLSEAEIAAHGALIESLGAGAVWLHYRPSI